MKKITLQLFLMLCCLVGFSQTKEIDSLLKILPQCKGDTTELKINIRLARLNYNIQNFEAAEKFAHRVISLSDSLLSTRLVRNNEQLSSACNIWKVYGCTNLGISFSRQKNDGESLRWYDSAVAVIRREKWWTGFGNTYNNLGLYYQKQGEYVKSLNAFIEALNRTEAAHDSINFAYFAWMISRRYAEQKNYSESLRYDTLALKMARETNAKGWRYAPEPSPGHKNTANHNHLIKSVSTYAQQAESDMMELKNFTEAIKYGEESFRCGQEAQDSLWMIMELQNIGLSYQSLKNRNEAENKFFYALAIANALGDLTPIADALVIVAANYRADSVYNKALENYQSALKIYTQINDLKGMASCYIDIGECEFEKGNTALALRWLNKGLQTGKGHFGLFSAEEAVAPTWLIVYSDLAKAYEKAGDFKNALKYHLLYVDAKDSLLSDQNKWNLNEIVTKYETDKKDNQIKLLNKDKEIETAEIGKQKVLRNGFIAGFGVVALFLGVVFVQRNRISKEKDRSESLLLNILPSEVATELKAKGEADAKLFEDVSVLFTDFKNFTTTSERLTPQELVSELHQCFKGFDEIIGKYKIEKIKTVGDAYMAASGLPVANPNHAADIVNAAIEIRNFMLNRRKELGERTFEVRVGINSGKVVAGIVGVKKFAYDIWGDTVNTAARMEQNGQPGKVNISETTYELVRDKFTSEYRGEIEAKNKGMLKMYFVER